MPMKMSRQQGASPASAPKAGFWRRAVDMYVGGFREMTVGRKLWAIILIKLAVIFLIFKVFLFPDILQRDYDNDADRARAVRTNLMSDDK